MNPCALGWDIHRKFSKVSLMEMDAEEVDNETAAVNDFLEENQAKQKMLEKKIGKSE